jgi:predicted acylesterase/phospholipase RssA
MSICFTGSGTNVIFQAGIAYYLQNNFDLKNVSFYGSSGGSIIATLLACGKEVYDFSNFHIDAYSQVKKVQKSTFGRMNFSAINQDHLSSILYKNENNNKIIQNVNGRLFISLSLLSSTYPFFTNKIAFEFQNVQDIIDATVASCWLPFFMNVYPTYQNSFCFDGSITNNFPIKNKNTIVVCPYNNNIIVDSFISYNPFNNPMICGNYPVSSCGNLYDEFQINSLFLHGIRCARIHRSIFEEYLKKDIINPKL